MDEIVQEFLVESRDGLDRLDRDLVALEQQPGSSALLAGIFRTMHTIKGTSGFLALHRVEELTHAGEGLLAGLRDGALCLTPDVTSVLLDLVDALRALLTSVELTGSEGSPDVAPLLARLATAQQQDGPAGTSEGLEAPSRRLGELLVAHGAAQPQQVAAAVLAQQVAGDGRRLGDILLAAGAVQLADLDHALRVQARTRHVAVATTVRVDVALLDGLLVVVGELAGLQARLCAQAAARGDEELVETAERLGTLVGALQGGAVQARLQPVDALWQKVPRLVRDLAVQCGKQVRVVMEGQETVVDRLVLEALRDPLTHLLRNAVDHAVETPEQRIAAGKPVTGVLRLRAWPEGDDVVLEVTDDGRGIDPRRVAAAALERGVLSAAELALLTAREVVDLIFEPGFSTAATVTHLSGRGVGMDVVHDCVQSIGGSIDVRSAVGTGTTFAIRVPAVLADDVSPVVGHLQGLLDVVEQA